MEKLTDYEKTRIKIMDNRHGNRDREPEPIEYVLDKIGYDPEQDGLYLCRRGCGITWDGECNYGGWHTEADQLVVKFSLDQ